MEGGGTEIAPKTMSIVFISAAGYFFILIVYTYKLLKAFPPKHL